jgi:ubiquinone/menaquinone biosynthesis C-methylase UbiE
MSVRDSFYRLLNRPIIYRAAQFILAPGRYRLLDAAITELLTILPPAAVLLDVGCGPSSQLQRLGLQPVGVDLSLSYLRDYTRVGALGVQASAAALPFQAETFDGVWSIGLLHHLPDAVLTATIGEFRRVCRPAGYVVVIDAVQPQSSQTAHPWLKYDREAFEGRSG